MELVLHPILVDSICDLQTWYVLSDYKVEDRLNNSLSFTYFCGMHVDEVSPDHSTLSRFKNTLTKTKTFEKLFVLINAQLETHNIFRFYKHHVTANEELVLGVLTTTASKNRGCQFI